MNLKSYICKSLLYLEDKITYTKISDFVMFNILLVA